MDTPKTTPSKSKPKNTAEQFAVEPIIAFYIFAAANLLAAFYAPIQDCDEVYNYWEPTHYLMHGYGLQTWEYSPEYAIRSWLYISLHAIVGKLGSFFLWSKTAEFYFLRSVLALVCAFCESRLFSTIAKALNPRVGIMFMMVMLSSPGIFQAAAAYLPSSFAMYCAMLGMSAFLDWRGGSKTDVGIMWFGIGGLIGWPFATALVIPFLLQEVIMAVITQEGIELLRLVLNGTLRCTATMIIQLAVEAFFYHKPVIVSWNLVRYNVFSGSNKGPDIFGTEPWDFYFRNLLLNFNIWMVLALLAAPLLVLQFVLSSQAVSRFALLRSFFFTFPFYMWMTIFTIQPHKEERFMYPVYPFLSLNAAMSLHTILGWFGNPNPATPVGKIPPKIKLLFVTSCVILAIDAGLLRTIGMITAYRAPLQVYGVLQKHHQVGSSDTICVGKEWYRYPSSYFLPNDAHAKFIKSEFTGLLPGEFTEAKTGFGFFPGAWLVPSGMNDRNIADPSKYTDIRYCSFLVDLAAPDSNGTQLEPNYILDEVTWEEVECKRFLDTSRTSLIGRLLWLPELPLIPEKHRRQWGRYCLLRRRSGPNQA